MIVFVGERSQSTNSFVKDFRNVVHKRICQNNILLECMDTQIAHANTRMCKPMADVWPAEEGKKNDVQLRVEQSRRAYDRL